MFFVIALIILGIELIVGMIANGLMVAVNCLQWLRSRNLTCCDMILTSLGISRFFLQCMIIISNIIVRISLDGKAYFALMRTFAFVSSFVSTLSFWFATWLSVFYCAKIASFSHPVFLWLKGRVLGLMPQLLTGTLLISFVIGLPSVNVIGRNYVNSSLTNLSGNTRVAWTYNTNFFSSLYLLGHFVPLIMFFVSSALLILSLWRHSKRMAKTCRDTVTQAHIRALMGQLSFFFFHLSYFMVQVLLSTGLFAHSLLSSMWFVVIMLAYPSGHSVILILGNPKLKKVAVRAFHCARDRPGDKVS